MNEKSSCKCPGNAVTCQYGTTSDHLSEATCGERSPASKVTYVDGDQQKHDITSPHRNGSECAHSPLSATKTKCEIVLLRLKTEDKDSREVSSDVVLWNQPEEVTLCSEDKDNPPAAEQPEDHNDREEFKSNQCQHIKKHNGGAKPFKCIYCPKTFTFRNPLIVHLRTHAKEKPFFCPVCGMNFSLRSHLKWHMKTHAKKMAAVTSVQEEEDDAVVGLISSDGEELERDPGICKVIPNVHQTDDQHLDRSVDRSSCCSVCGQTFSNSRGLQRHQRTHTGTTPHKCSHCGAAFRVLKRLKRHLLIHNKEKPFSCPVCDTRFSREDRLKKHLSEHRWSAEAKEAAEALGGAETAGTLISSSAGKAADVTLPDDPHTPTPAKPEHIHSLNTA